jgi:iron complex outermembrane recepter protein
MTGASIEQRRRAARLISLIIAGCSANVLWSYAAWSAEPSSGAAVEPAEDPVNSSVGGDTGTVPEVIVTAQKRAENLETVPLSISAITSETLQNDDVHDFSRLDKLVPGVKFGESGNDARPAIRGTRTQNVIGNADPLVAFYADGIYRSRPGQSLDPFVDLARVEVLRGPQGTLFGRNSFGGTVNVITSQPKLDNLDFGGAVEVTNYEGRRQEGFINLPLNDVLAVRLSGYDSQREGWVKNSSANNLHDDDNQVIRGQVLFQPSDTFSNLLRVEYWHGGGAGPGDFGYYTPGIPIDPATGLTNGVHGVIDPRIVPLASDPTGSASGGYAGLAAGTTGDPDYQHISRNFKSERSIHQTSVSDEANLGIADFANLRGIFSYTNYKEYRQTDPDYSDQLLNWEGDRETAKTWSEELQLTSKSGGSLAWVLGAYFLQDRPTSLYLYGTDLTGKVNPATGLPYGITQTLNPIIDPSVYVGGPGGSDTDSTAFYGDGTYEVVQGLRIIAGVRWTEDKKKAFYENPLGDEAGEPPTRAEKTFNRVTYRGGLQYDLAQHSMLYGTYSTGYLSGGFNTGPTNQSFDPTYVKAIEIGSKNVLFDGQMRADFSIYHNDYTNIVTQRLVQQGPLIVTFAENAGEIKSYGAEAELAYYPVRAASLLLNAAYNHSRFGDFVAANSFNEGGNLAKGAFFQLDGYQVPLNPTFTVTLTGSYNFDLGNTGVITPSATVFHTSSYRTSDQPYFFSNQGAYTTLDAFVRWRPSEDSKIAVEAYGDNLTDKRILLRTTPNTGQVIFQDFANPRLYGLRISYNY